MNDIIIKLNELILVQDYNINEFSQEIFNKLTNSLKMFGCIQPLVVNEIDGKYFLIDGYTRYKILQNLNFSEVRCTVYKDLSESKSILLKLNMNLFNEYDILKTSKVLLKIKEKIPADRLEKYTNFTKDQIEKYQSIYGWDWYIRI